MNVRIKTAHGYLSFTPTGRIEYRDEAGVWENLNIEGLELQPQPVPPPPEPVPPPPEPTRTPREQFLIWISGKPFGQQTLLNLEYTLNAYGWKLTPPNANGDRTKIQIPSGEWVRVGFGEGHWVWLVQPK